MQQLEDQRDNIRLRIIQFINDNFLLVSNKFELNPDDSFLEKGIIDSTGVLELVNFLEESFNIKINDEELVPENLDSINRLIAFVEKKLLLGKDFNC